MVFRDNYEEAWRKGYRDLDNANLYNVDYSMIGTARVEPLIRRIRNSMMGAGMRVENSKGECNFGQHEINFHYGPALKTADDHAIYKTGAKEIAAQQGMSIIYMAKFDEREGNSCHIHLSLQRPDGIESELALEPPFNGNAYESDKPRVPSTLRDARDLFAGSAIAREAFGEEVISHYVNMADVELAAFDSAVTDWERYRSFERM